MMARVLLLVFAFALPLSTGAADAWSAPIPVGSTEAPIPAEPVPAESTPEAEPDATGADALGAAGVTPSASSASSGLIGGRHLSGPATPPPER